MDLSSFLGYAESLAMLYGWTLCAAALFWLGEKIVANYSARRSPPRDGAADSFKDAAS